jgi:hypothetical protein
MIGISLVLDHNLLPTILYTCLGGIISWLLATGQEEISPLVNLVHI